MSKSIIAAHRLRLGRVSEPGRVYLLTTVVSNREPVFRGFPVGRLLVAELRATQENGWAKSLAWVVMPDHLHWLVALHDTPLDALMRRFKSNSARSINRHLNRQGALWQPGYHDRALRHDDNLLATARYIVANPLRAGLVKRIGDYPLWDAVWL